MAVHESNVINCMDCKSEMELDVQSSAAGYYLGYFCPQCGPYDRVSGYFKDYGEAKVALKEAGKAPNKSYFEGL